MRVKLACLESFLERLSRQSALQGCYQASLRQEYACLAMGCTSNISVGHSQNSVSSRAMTALLKRVLTRVFISLPSTRFSVLLRYFSSHCLSGKMRLDASSARWNPSYRLWIVGLKNKDMQCRWSNQNMFMPDGHLHPYPCKGLRVLGTTYKSTRPQQSSGHKRGQRSSLSPIPMSPRLALLNRLSEPRNNLASPYLPTGRQLLEVKPSLPPTASKLPNPQCKGQSRRNTFELQ